MERNDLDILFSASNLTETERHILQFILDYLTVEQSPTIRMVADSCHTSMTSVTRTARKLGYGGFREMVYGLSLEAIAPQQSLISSEELQATFSYTPHDLELFFRLLSLRGTVGIHGEGYSHLISEYIERKLLGIGHIVVEQKYLDPQQFVDRLSDSLTLVILVSKSGTTPSVVDTARQCKEHGIPTAVFTGRRTSELVRYGDMIFLINDDQPLDANNTEPSSFTGCCILAFERILSQYRSMLRENTEVLATRTALRPPHAAHSRPL